MNSPKISDEAEKTTAKTPNTKAVADAGSPYSAVTLLKNIPYERNTARHEL
jgi:hypothetical protein